MTGNLTNFLSLLFWALYIVTKQTSKQKFSISLPCDETPCWICDKFSGMAIVAAEAAAVCWKTTTEIMKVLQRKMTN